MNRHQRRKAAAQARRGYMHRLAAAAELLRPGEIAAATVSHDESCDAPSGAPCTCTPTIEIADGSGTVIIVDEDGNASKLRSH